MSVLKSLTDVIGVFLEIFIISGFFSMFAKARYSPKYMVLIYGFYLVIVFRFLQFHFYIKLIYLREYY